MAIGLERLEQQLEYEFSDQALLELALTHRSRGSRNNERLEFLGDSILNHIAAQALFHQFEGSREGDLSRMRASLVKGETLADIARELELGSYLLLGPGEMKSGGHRRDSILADTLEALIGAILLDSDVERCRVVVERLLLSRLLDLSERSLDKDGKTRLQEYLQSRGKSLPDYQLDRVEGEDHRQQFYVHCDLPQFKLSVPGSGSSRRKAEQMAAAAALEALQSDD